MLLQRCKLCLKLRNVCAILGLEVVDCFFKLCNILLKLWGVNHGNAYCKGKSSLAGDEVLGFGRDHLHGDGRADLYTLVNRDGIAADRVALAIHYCECGRIKEVVDRVGGTRNIHDVAGHYLIKRCAYRDGGLTLLNLEGAGAREVATDGSGGYADIIIISISDDTAKLLGVERKAVVPGDQHLGRVGTAVIEEFCADLGDLYRHGDGSDDQIILQNRIRIIGRIRNKNQHLMRACIGGSISKRRAIFPITNSDVLLVKSYGERLYASGVCVHIISGV